MSTVFALLAVLAQENLAGASVREARWIEVPASPDELLNDVFFLNAASGWTVGRGSCIRATADGGRTWTSLDVKGARPPLDYWRGIRFLDADHGIVVGGLSGPEGPVTPARILSTRDGGRTWVDVTPPAVAAGPQDYFDAVRFVSGKDGFALGSRSFATHDGGITWTELKDGRALSGRHCVFSTTQLGWRITGMEVLKTDDGGSSWKITSASQALSEDERIHGSLESIDFLDERNGWVSAGRGGLLKTEDGGVSWKALDQIGPGSVRHVRFANLLHGWALLEHRGQWILTGTVDGGRTWKEAFRTSRELRELFLRKKDLGWAVGDKIVVRLSAAP